MYYSDGETLIFRSDQQRRPPPRQAPREPQRATAPDWNQLVARMSKLEERLSQLEQRLAAAQSAPPARRRAQEPEDLPTTIAASDIRVSLHADGGAMATVGPIKIEHE